MKVLRYFSVALDSIIAHKMRAVLTMLGIIIGVAAVLTTMGFGSGAAADITANIESGGTNLLTIRGGASGGGNGGNTLTMADAKAIADPIAFPDVGLVAPQYSSSASLTKDGQDGTYQVVGTTANYGEVTNLDIANGQFLSEENVALNESVIVLGATVATDLFGALEPVGQTVRVNNNLFTVVGVLEESGGNGFGSNDTQTYVPIAVAQGRLFNATRYRGNYPINTISIQVRSTEAIDAAELQIEQTLRMRHGLGLDTDNDFTIFNQADLLETIGEVTATLSILLGSIGGISLLVGGIGIMNIMLVSVTERTREIGLRKAVGAHTSDILLQFLVEALVLTTMGGLIGIGFSYLVAYVLSKLPFMPFAIVFEYRALALAIGVSSASGFIFGLYPAWRATQLDPIEALRYE